MSESGQLTSRLMARIRAGLANHPDEGPLLTLTLETPGIRLHSLPELTGEWVYWGHPAQQEYLLGYGTALQLVDRGEGRLQRLTREFRDLRRRWRLIDPDDCGETGLLFTGFAFAAGDPMTALWEGVPNALLRVPEILVHQKGRRCFLSFSTQPGERPLAETMQRWEAQLQRLLESLGQPAGSQERGSPLAHTGHSPPDDHWLGLVQRAVTEIADGTLEKVVPTRQVSVQASHPLNPARLMATLDGLYPDSRHFSINQGGRVFTSVTPERLLACREFRLVCDAVGGTIGRSPDRTLDRLLGQRLMRDPKARHEHELVVRDIRSRMAPFCTSMERPREPRLWRLRNLQHLYTEIHGNLPQDDVDLLAIAAALHPTAAVNGYPPSAAQAWLRSQQPDHRGWYTGAAGWLDCRGNGELAVLLRCSLLHGSGAVLFAGAGVTGASKPEDELLETDLKLGTMLEALGHA